MAESVAARPLSVGEVADLLGLHRKTVKKIPPAELPFARVAARGDRRYDRTDVEAYLARRREG